MIDSLSRTRWKPHIRTASGWVFSGILLYWATTQVQGERIQQLLGHWRWPEFLLAAAIVPLQIALAARRWNLTASRLGVGLNSRHAFGEYYFSTLVNQLLPGGIAGDLIRIYRHGSHSKGERPIGKAIRAAVIERSFGAFVCGLLALLALLVWPFVTSHSRPSGLLPLVLCLCSMFALCSLWPKNRTILAKYRFLSQLGNDLRHCIWHKDVRRQQWQISITLALSLIFGFALVGLALEPLAYSTASDQTTQGIGLLAFIAYPLIFLAMTIPIGPGGWGIREASSTVLLPSLGATPDYALAISIAYGLAVLLGSLPGIFWIYREAFSGVLKPPSIKFGELKVWVALALVNALLLLPRIIGKPEEFAVFLRFPGGKAPIWAEPELLFSHSQEHFYRFSGDFLITATLLLVCSRLIRSTMISRCMGLAVRTIFIVTLIYEVNLLVGILLMNQEPLFYDEYFLFFHFFVLLNDLISPALIAGVVAAVMAITGLIYLGIYGIRFVECNAKYLGWRSVAIGGVGWFYMTLGTIVSGSVDRQNTTQWMSMGIFNNIQDSRVAWRRVHRRVTRSPYATYDEQKLSEKPSIALYIIESYGRIMAEYEPLTEPWKQLLESATPELERAGWSMLSGYSRSPVSGGRSWLADGSMFFGHSIRYEAEYRHLLQQVDRIPNLVSYLQKQGYHTLRLAPSDRSRPGIRNPNDWGFDTMITYDQMGYNGPHVGWGLIPDQFSLGKLHEEILLEIPEPRFVYFHMVSAHAPWKDTPEPVDDWRDLNDIERITGSVDHDNGHSLAFRGAKRFRRMTKPRFPYAGDLNHTRAQQYAEAILYDISILTSYLCSVESADIVIIMGDHQPPLLTRHTKNFDVPMHIFARDPKWLNRFEREGFTPGLIPPLNTSKRKRRGHSNNIARITHEEIFPILVKSLKSANTQNNPNEKSTDGPNKKANKNPDINPDRAGGSKKFE